MVEVGLASMACAPRNGKWCIESGCAAGEGGSIPFSGDCHLQVCNAPATECVAKATTTSKGDGDCPCGCAGGMSTGTGAASSACAGDAMCGTACLGLICSGGRCVVVGALPEGRAGRACGHHVAEAGSCPKLKNRAALGLSSAAIPEIRGSAEQVVVRRFDRPTPPHFPTVFRHWRQSKRLSF